MRKPMWKRTWKQWGVLALTGVLLVGGGHAQNEPAASAPALPQPIRGVPDPLLPAATVLRSWDLFWYAPRAVEFARRVDGLGQALDSHCQGGLVIPVRQAWRDAVAAWTQLSTVTATPLLADERSARLDTQPVEAAAIEQVLAAGGGSVDVAALPPAARGLGALEWLLWSPPPGQAASSRAAPRSAAPRGRTVTKPRSGSAKTKPGTKLKTQASSKPTAKPGTKPSSRKTAPSASRRGAAVASPQAPSGSAASSASRTTQAGACRYAQALVADLRDQSRAIAEGFALRLENPLPEAQAQAQLAQALTHWVAGLEALRVQAIERPLQDSAGKARSRPAFPRWLSGGSVLDRSDRWTTLRRLALADAAETPAPGTALLPLELWLRDRGQMRLADQLRQHAAEVDAALPQAIPNTPDALWALARSLGSLRDLVVQQVAPALEIGWAPS